MSIVSACLYVCLARTIHMLIFWICTACGGADVIRILKYNEDDHDSNKENVDPNPLVMSDDSSTMSAAAVRGEEGRPWWVRSGVIEDGSAASSMSAGPSDVDIFEGRVLWISPRVYQNLSVSDRPIRYDLVV